MLQKRRQYTGTSAGREVVSTDIAAKYYRCFNKQWDASPIILVFRRSII